MYTLNYTRVEIDEKGIKHEIQITRQFHLFISVLIYSLFKCTAGKENYINIHD